MAEISLVPRKFLSLLDSFIFDKPACPENECKQDKVAEDYFERVETYSAYTWLAKPPALSPLQCARYGWKNVDIDRLKCVTCSATLTVSLPLPSTRSQPCNQCFFCSYIVDITLDSSYSDEEATLLSCKEAVETLKDILDCQVILTDVDEEAQMIACILAFCGWVLKPSDKLKSSLLICSICRRRAGIWNYTMAISDSSTDSLELSSESIEEQSSSSPSKRRKIEKKKFNPIEEHRYWCPYFIVDDNNAESREDVERSLGNVHQDNNNDTAGLKSMLSYLFPKRHSRTTDPNLNSCSAKSLRISTIPHQDLCSRSYIIMSLEEEV
ncbi:uncharacterized protein TRIADDRAFT_55497 [Trichoplax adhaerens]|uniref:C3HC-type domain-containing protein n=1 Tax=Trichoplax adhaerens TaxID=10228 RepID=B3RV20_TRIAD|nr:hypothetical protein TRIADDRAFT_55497 [Trichoplax adhaerens]EDV25922.1 hypothetical protein TRIADDRAFT_55497 [Trichoplax adhaerens]|eukprot:XP_002111955.1 hypothetical protein TRIADDRAFT_55497 [Trichoplax adhaerens]